MSEPFWKSLASRVREEREDHLDPVREVIECRNPYASASGLAGVERELLEEIASSLSRAERRLDEAIARLRRLSEDASTDDATWEAARAEAIRLKRDLTIHREALRFPRDPELDRRHPIPPARRR